MSETVTALGGAHYAGYATITEQPARGMITLRGNLAEVAVKNAATGVAGVDMPDLRECHIVDQRGIAWMSPDELLVMVPHPEVASAVSTIQQTLSGLHSLVVDVSDARALFRIEGSGAREVLAKLCPVDLSPAAFGPGQIRRTRLGHVSAAFWMVDDSAFELVCFRSVAQYAFDLLKTAAEPGGEVGVF
ncbi:sarcosine oxidase subunit gamma [Actibacterium ureilyticum]|uniref:sarcosine oxidase subunit gamma n=1 Tax=Actibacterium ureilyticum TaxID=1590614 RepID=UPI000BAB21AF|nr:sarcosine oxidase subunit gamma family protein [Actibacterium ureilyticum]